MNGQSFACDPMILDRFHRDRPLGDNDFFANPSIYDIAGLVP
jgi:hypothetical protein